MAAKDKLFIIPATQHAPTTIQLGSILTSPTSPASSINSTSILPPPSFHVSAAYNITDATINPTKHYARQHGIAASWADKIGVNLGVQFDSTQSKKNKSSSESASASENETGLWHFDKLEKKLIVPDADYVARAMRTPQIQQWIRVNEERGEGKEEVLWMVTGIQIARGARREVGKKIGHSGAVLRDSGISLGSQGEIEGTGRKDGDVGDAVGTSTDFVYAYRVKEIMHRRSDVGTKGKATDVRRSVLGLKKGNSLKRGDSVKKGNLRKEEGPREGDLNVQRPSLSTDSKIGDEMEEEDGRYTVVLAK